jgi:hypothetical protein
MSPYRPQAPDTSVEADRRMIEHYRSLTLEQRVDLVFELTRRADEAALVGIRERYPDADEREQRLRLAALKYPRELLIRAFGWDPEERGY